MSDFDLFLFSCAAFSIVFALSTIATTLAKIERKLK